MKEREAAEVGCTDHVWPSLSVLLELEPARGARNHVDYAHHQAICDPALTKIWMRWSMESFRLMSESLWRHFGILLESLRHFCWHNL